MSDKMLYELFDVGGYHQTKDVLFGVECEIESVKGIPSIIQETWGIHEDGSLRNNGCVFVTWPVYRAVADILFNL